MKVLHQPPDKQVRCGPVPNPHGLKKVLHANSLTGEARLQLDDDLFEPRCSEAYHRIAGEAKAFTGDAQDCIQTLVVVFVMKEGQRVGPLGKAAEMDGWTCRWNGLAECTGVGPAIGKVRMVLGQARMDHAFGTSQSFDIDRQIGRRSVRERDQGRNGESRKADHCGERYREEPISATYLLGR